MAGLHPIRSLARRIDPAWIMSAVGRLPLKFNPLTREARRDPHPQFKRLREKAPVHFSPLFRGWVLTEYEDVASVLRDARFGTDRKNSPMFAAQLARFAEEWPELTRFSENTITRKDATEHTRLRNLVGKAFTPRIVRRLEPRIQQVVDRCIDDALGKQSLEVISELAFPLPVAIIAEMLGVDGADAERFKTWATDVFSLTDPATLFRREHLAKAEASVAEMRRYLQGMAAERRESPRDDLISALVAAEDEGERLSEDELISMCGALVLAGHETTTNLIGMAIHCLLRHPGERKRLLDAPELLPAAIEEVMRFEGVAHYLVRIALEDVEVGSGAKKTVVRRGQTVVLVLAAANRDPKQFPDPDRFDISRSPNRHLGLGHGAHFCLGANLARSETQTAVGRLLERLPDFSEMVVESEWKQNPTLRGLERLQLDWRA